MADNVRRFESMLFPAVTNSIGGDTIMGKNTQNVRTVYQAKAPCVRIRPLPLKYIHTLTNWRVPNVPFDLFGKPKDISRTNPYEIQKPYAQPPDDDQKVVQMTRPRLVITPAVSLDDMEDGPRKILIDAIYQTSAEYNTHGAFTGSRGVVAPLPGPSAPPNVITISKLFPPYVSPEWRMDTVTWDNRQLRTYADPVKEFWLARTPNCDVCKNTAAITEMRKMKQKI